MKGMRNFWITARCDGKQVPVAFGPGTSKDAGFSLQVHMLEDGESTHALSISGRVKRDGSLVLEVTSPDQSKEVYIKETKRGTCSKR